MAGRKSPTYRLGNFLYFVKDTCICSASAEGGQAIQILENAGVILRVVDQELDYTRETGGPTEVRFLDLKAFSLNSLRYRGLAYLAVCPSLLPREVSALQGKSVCHSRGPDFQSLGGVKGIQVDVRGLFASNVEGNGDDSRHTKRG